MAPMKNVSQSTSVYSVLSNNTATLHRDLWLDNGLGTAMWSNCHGQAKYDKPSHHTLSFYLNGGHQTRRVLRSGHLHGGSDKLCIMPQGHQSHWTFNDQFQFLHCYFTQAHLDTFSEQVFDKDGRNIELIEQTFVADPFIQQLVRSTILPMDWLCATDTLMVAHAQQLLLLHLLKHHCHTNARKNVLTTGGLSPTHRRRVIEFIAANLSQPISLSNLAAIVQLSEFHFARMFKTSFGCSAYQYVLDARIALAKELLHQNKLSLITIADMCGFSSQQHFSTQFRKRVGVTPRQFQRG
ncbi:helix-turn-helix transcriptional regulator [Vibrio sp. SM6]|uniref:Helix-turn-helix transcriptional regulator n=2 Tax=Vibrio agarilyticus TaxID=2726741 RepID=A0A7X8TUE2_9VIBR|nr:AraC family transcriptional regulator [Vibrio agarilyticus]NLS14806.1 helix-turn-helix transcriptional regulator [Vibrio agarilyticus]